MSDFRNFISQTLLLTPTKVSEIKCRKLTDFRLGVSGSIHFERFSDGSQEVSVSFRPVQTGFFENQNGCFTIMPPLADVNGIEHSKG